MLPVIILRVFYGSMGMRVKLIPPQYVKPYVKTNKTDAADAEAICEAVARPNMRFVQIKTAEQQAILVLHTERNILIRERTACANSMRAILAEFGIIMPRTLSQLYKKIPEILEEYDNELSPFVRCSVARQLEHLQGVEDQITLIEQELSRWAKTQPACQRVMKVPGVGLMTATYLVASVGNGQHFIQRNNLLPGWDWCRESSQVAVSRDWAESAKEVTAISVIFWSMVRGQLQPLLRDTKTICRGFTGC